MSDKKPEKPEKQDDQQSPKPIIINGKPIGYVDNDGHFAFFHNDTKDSPLSNAYVSKSGFNLYFRP